MDNHSRPSLTGLRILAAAVLVAAGFIFHTWLRTKNIRKGYEAAQIRTRVNQLESDLMSLIYERDQQLSAPALKLWADRYREQGVVFQAPEAKQIVYVRDGGK